MIGGANRLCCIFDDRNAVTPAQREQRVHLGALPVDVHRHDRLRARRDRARNLRHVEIVSMRIDIDEHRPRAEPRDTTPGRKKAERRRDDLAAGADVEGHHRKQQRIRTGSTTDRIFRVTILGNRAFQPAHFIAEHKALRLQHTFNCRAHFVSERGILRL